MPTQTASSDNRRYFQIGGITISVESDIPITDKTFHAKFKSFECREAGAETIFFKHHFFIPALDCGKLGEKVYRHPPWEIYRSEKCWTYLGIYDADRARRFHRVAVFSPDHTTADLYHPEAGRKVFRKGGIASLSLLPTDQIVLARVLADRQGCILHAAGVILEKSGLLFVGHSEAGKSTLVEMLRQEAETLCDDRIIVRLQPEGYRIYGTWSHGEVARISPASAPLKAIFFLKQAGCNRVLPLADKQEIVHRLLACLIKPLVTADWWHSMLNLVPRMAAAVPCYTLEFDKSGAVVELLRDL